MTDGSRSDSARSSTRSTAGDPELIVAARAGDGSAFAVLRRRHEGAALRLATLLTGSVEAAAIVTERAFDNTRRMLESGGGPDCAFRLQILRAVRSAAPASIATELDEAVGAAAAVSAAGAEFDPIVGRSFLALPERWGSVLWHTDVEGQTDAEVASLLGMRTATVTGLAARSREGLVRGYLARQVHQLDDPACSQVLDRLQLAISSPSVGAEDAAGRDASVHEHLAGCDGCRTAARMLTTLTHDPAPALAAVVLGEQGIPYLEAARGANDDGELVATRVPARPRAMRLVLVAVALIAVTASVPALRAGAGSDESAAAGFDPSLDRMAATADPAAGAVSTADEVTDRSLATTAPAGSTTGRATITTTGVNGLPTRVSVSTSTSIGLDGMPTTVAVIPGVAGGPATTVTGSFPSDGIPVFEPWTTDSTAGSDTGTTGPGATPTWSGGPTSTTGQYRPPLFAPAAPTQHSGPAGPGRTVPGTTMPGTTVPGTTVPGTTAPWTTVPASTVPATTVPGTTRPGTTAPGTSTSAATFPATTAMAAPTNPPAPTTADASTTSAPDPTTDSTPDPTTTTTTTTTSDEPTTTTTTTTTTTSDEPTTSAPPAPEPDVEVRGPAPWVVTLVGALPVDSSFTLVNRTGVKIPAQQLRVTLPAGIEVEAEGAASGCAPQDVTTWTCTVDALAASDGEHSMTLKLTGGGGSGNGPITMSVTGNEVSGEVVSVL